MSDNIIRISYVRAKFAAGLLEGCRYALLGITDLLDPELDAAQVARRSPGARRVPPEPAEQSQLVAAALLAEWIADTLHRQVAFYIHLDNKLAQTFDAPELPPTEQAPHAPPEWPQPAMPAPLTSTTLYGNEDAVDTASSRRQVAMRMHDILDDLDDAIRAIDYSRRVRLQAEISDAARRLRAWVASSLPADTDDRRTP